MSANPYRRPVEVRFRDIDVMGVAHHTLPLVYFEETRAAWWREVIGRSGTGGIDYILAEVQVRYHLPIRWPALLEITLRVSRIGERSFDLDYQVIDPHGDVAATGKTVQVMYDYAGRRPKPIPADVRQLLDAASAGS